MITSKPTETDVFAVELRGITKRFPGVVANQAVDFAVRSGEIHALLGENGAGKTTLMNILCGLYEPDAGEIRLFGQSVRLASPAAAIAAGIGMVHQHFMLVESFTVAENIILGQQGRRWLREPSQRLHPRLQRLAEQYGLAIDPAAQVWQLSVGEQQRVEILKALYRNAKILILDEPTAVLTPQEAEELMQTLRHLAAQGTAIIFISHKLKEVMAVCHRVTVLRDGQTVGCVPIADCTESTLAQRMVGRAVNLQRPPQQPAAIAPDRPPLLQLQDVWVQGDRQRFALCGVSLAVHPSEIVGIAGVDGNGQRELEAAIVGIRSLSRGTIDWDGTLAHIPSDRYAMAVLPDFSVAENLVLKTVRHRPFSDRGWLRTAYILRHAATLIQQYFIRTPSIKTPMGKLSGGNTQKAIFARELSRDPQVILAAQPTRGVDIGATEFIHAQLRARRDAGAAILLISTELDEILNLSDRIAVLYEGKIVGWVTTTEATLDELGLLMAGKTNDSKEEHDGWKRSG